MSVSVNPWNEVKTEATIFEKQQSDTAAKQIVHFRTIIYSSTPLDGVLVELSTGL